MTPQELIVAGYSIDICHEPIWPTSNYNADESRAEMYHRHEVTIQEIIEKHKHEGKYSYNVDFYHRVCFIFLFH